MKKRCIGVYLKFEYLASDGTVVQGNGRMATYITGELPRIGERVYPATGHTHINMTMERYCLRVVDVCHTTGGDYIPSIYCEVSESQRSIHTGKIESPERRGREEMIDEWKNLVGWLSANFSKEREEGSKIVVLELDGQHLA